MLKNIIKNHLFPLFMVAAGAVLAAFALEEFLIPSTILDGGITGISIILNKLTHIHMSIFIVVLNLPFLIIGFRHIGARFFVRGIFGMVLFSVMLEVFRDLTNVTENELLAVVFGGIILGAGVGLVLRYGGCLDGTEIVALMISKKTSLSLGQVILLINILIYAAAGLLFGLDRAMYSLMTYFITFKIIDIVEQGMDQAKAVMIITERESSVAEEIYKHLGRTCTLLEGEGLVSGQKTILYCVITRVEMSELKQIIHSLDESAFVTISDVSEIIGHHIKHKDEKLISAQTNKQETSEEAAQAAQ